MPQNSEQNGQNSLPESEPSPAIESQTGEVVTIKKYANRRLYNTATSAYVTLDHLCQMVKNGIDFVVQDAKTGEDITRQVLTQIIVEEEGKGQNMLPISFLRQLIGLYGDNMQFLVPRYLEETMKSFSANQDRFRLYMQETFGGIFPFNRMEEVGKQNIAMFEQAMRMFSPFSGPAGAASRDPSSETVSQSGSAEKKNESSTVHDLEKRLDQLQAELARIKKTQDT
ncbi:MAG: polyhydroxyalkanoate synthesis repressor PhaR [Alphaproteobacteria bacterium]